MQNKVVIITGASSGIGKALVYEFAKRGAKIAMGARNLDELQKIETDLKSRGIDALSVQTDVTRELDCKNLVEKTVERFGKIDVLVNNAGISMRALFEDLELDVIRRLMDVNFWGTVYCTGRTGYSASKFAVRGFLNTLRVENLKKGLHVLVAAPGFTASNIRKTALVADGHQQGDSPRAENKMMSAERCAQIIVNGVVKRKREIVMTLVEGKISVFLSKWFPSLLDKLAYSHMAKEPDSPFK